jgi:hypothetical protein
MKMRMGSNKDRIYYVTIYCDDCLFGFVDCEGVYFEYPENMIGVDEL